MTSEELVHESIAECVKAAAERLITRIERSTVWSFSASVPIHMAAVSGDAVDRVDQLVRQERFLRASAWVLEHPSTR